MAIKLSLNKTLYSYDGQLEAYVTDTTVVKVQIHTDYDLSDSVLVYQQGDVQDSVAIINNVAEIPGLNIRSGQLSVAVLYDNTLSNFVQIYASKSAALSQNLLYQAPRTCSRSILMRTVGYSHSSSPDMLTGWIYPQRKFM